MANDVRITGVDQLQRALKRAGPLAIAALAASAVEEQHRVIADAQGRTPVDKGVLRASGTVLPPQVSPTRVEVTAGFGGAASDYAIVVHENLQARHTVGEAKFLETSFLQRARTMPHALAKGVELALQRLKG